MSQVLEDRLSDAMHGVETVKDGTMSKIRSVMATMAEGVGEAMKIVSTLRKLDRDDGLGWFGLARRRSPLVPIAVFGAGALVGAGVALMFAPMSGADLRTALLKRSNLASAAKSIETKVEDAAKKARPAVEDAATAVKGVVHDVTIASAGGTPDNGQHSRM